MPRSAATVGQGCKEGKFAKGIARFCKLGFDVRSWTTVTCVVDLAIFAGFVSSAAEPPKQVRDGWIPVRAVEGAFIALVGKE
jgi:hypothetical protein